MGTYFNVWPFRCILRLGLNWLNATANKSKASSSDHSMPAGGDQSHAMLSAVDGSRAPEWQHSDTHALNTNHRGGRRCIIDPGCA